LGSDENWEASDELRQFIRGLLTPGSTILELGSGTGTAKLAENYEMISIEHDERFVGRYKSRYIHAPIQPFRKPCSLFTDDTGWYNREVLRRELPGLKYQLILVDGPPNSFGRGGFYKWKELFNFTVPIIFDDVHRRRETTLIQRVSAHLKRPYTVHSAWTPKHFGVILP